VFRRIEELAAEAGYLVSARADAMKARARRAAMAAAVGAIAAVGAAALLAVAVVELVSGIAGALGELFGARWLGGITTGVLLLAGMAAAVVFGTKRMARRSREQTLARYAERKAAQRRRFGHDFAELAHHDGNGGRAS
jgi:hypothetical protein